jgi:hypothetical protein
MTLTLNTNVRIVSRSGSQQCMSVREVIAIGSGKAYEGIIMLDEWQSLLEAYKAEQDKPLVVMKDRINYAKKSLHKALVRLSELQKEYKAIQTLQGAYLGTRSRTAWV